MSLTRDQYASTIKAGASDIGTNLAMAAITAEVPIFLNPILNTILRAGVSWLLEKLIQQTEFGLFFSLIDARTSQQGRDFFDAVQRRQAILKTGTAKEKQDAEDNQIRNFYKLASLRS